MDRGISSYQPSGLSDWKETVNLIKKGLSPSICYPFCES